MVLNFFIQMISNLQLLNFTDMPYVFHTDFYKNFVVINFQKTY